jgi:hypothetical protein
MVSGEGFISKCVNAESGTGVGNVLLEAVPPPEDWPDGWFPDDAWLLEPDELPDDEEPERAPPGVPLERLFPLFVEPPTTFDWAVTDAGEPLLLAEVSCDPCVMEELAFEDAVSVVT